MFVNNVIDRKKSIVYPVKTTCIDVYNMTDYYCMYPDVCKDMRCPYGLLCDAINKHETNTSCVQGGNTCCMNIDVECAIKCGVCYHVNYESSYAYRYDTETSIHLDTIDSEYSPNDDIYKRIINGTYIHSEECYFMRNARISSLEYTNEKYKAEYDGMFDKTQLIFALSVIGICGCTICALGMTMETECRNVNQTISSSYSVSDIDTNDMDDANSIDNSIEETIGERINTVTDDVPLLSV
jgi:hypothetical protein